MLSPNIPVSLYNYEELASKKALNPFSIKIELLISRYYSAYIPPLERISDPYMTSKEKTLSIQFRFLNRRGYKLAQRNEFFLEVMKVD